MIAPDRRRHARRTPSDEEPLARVRLRTGRELCVRDLADGGALVEGARLLPGTHVTVHVTTGEGRVLVRSRVVRAWVCALAADAVAYRAALVFERPLHTAPVGYAIPCVRTPAADAQGNPYPDPAPQIPAVDHLERSA